MFFLKKTLLFLIVLLFLTVSPAQVLAVGEGWWSTQGGKIVDSRGQEVLIRGVNWGFEVYREDKKGRLDGSDVANYKEMLQSMSSFGFNTIRFVWRDWQLEDGCVFQGKNNFNPELKGLSCLEVMDQVINYASSLNMRIILDHHTMLRSWTRSPALSKNWRFLAERYKNNPYVIGADLDNEPHHSLTCWGCGVGKDWRLGAELLGNEVLKVNPKWLIIVEGVLGIDLAVARQHPVRLSNPNQLVYSIHVYPGVTHGVALGGLVAAWDEKFGYLSKENIAPVLIGEFQQTSGNVAWFVSLINYMKDNGISGTVWAWRYTGDEPPTASYYTVTQINKDYLTVVNDGRTKPLKDWLVRLDRNPGFSPPPPSPPPLPSPAKKAGDADGNGRVDFADFQILKANFGLPGRISKGNFNLDGVVDGLDYAIWFSNFGK
jgi:endoglucanase